ncbi:hypothetical protein Aperf_G00000068465 [Anoplocephala perfoliata]
MSWQLTLLYLCLLIAIDAKKDPLVTDKVYFDITIGGRPEGRIVIGLFGEVVPKTVANFKAFAEGYEKNGTIYGYAGTIFYSVLSKVLIEGGDVTNGDGTGGFSIYGDKFDDENFELKHDDKGHVSMASKAINSNKSQFLITLTKTPWLDGCEVLFGKVIEGMDVVEKIGRVETGFRSRPLVEVKIASSGVLTN